ncbi:MAG: branched-chain amino acid ABC transporter permease [Rhodospirillales bacterium]|nr:branched-chain amino acid ABC transporter permease [Rhodospirillales bacterium]
MPFELYLNQIVSGLLTGLVYGLSALGLSVIFGVVKIVNFAHGEMMVIGMYLALLLFRFAGLDPLLSIPIVALILFGLGYALQATVINRLIEVPDYMQFLLLAGIAIIIVSLSLIVFGPDAQNVQLSYAYDSVQIGLLIIDKARLLAGAAAVGVAAALFLFFEVFQPRDDLAVDSVGPDQMRVRFDVALGDTWGLLDDRLLLQPSLKSMFSFGLLILVLIFRPQGLLGKRT